MAAADPPRKNLDVEFFAAEHKAEIIFTGSLKDDYGDYEYTDDTMSGWHLAGAPTLCGVFRDPQGKMWMNYTIDQSPIFTAPYLTWQSLLTKIALAPPNSKQIIYRHVVPGTSPELTIILETFDGASRLTIDSEFGINQFSTSGTGSMHVFDFRGDKLTGIEERHYIDPARPNMPNFNQWPGKRLPRLKKDENGRSYYLSWACENSVTS